MVKKQLLAFERYADVLGDHSLIPISIEVRPED